MLVVSLVPDVFVQKARPMVYDEDTRMAMLLSVKHVDRVILCGGLGPQAVIASLKPDLYVRGFEYESDRRPEVELLERLGIPIRYTKKLDYPRTTEILNRIWQAAP